MTTEEIGREADDLARTWANGYEAGKAAGRAEGTEAERKRCADLAARLAVAYPVTCQGGRHDRAGHRGGVIG